jgi:hypothetical protein
MLEELVFSTSVTLLVKLQELERKEASLTRNKILINLKFRLTIVSLFCFKIVFDYIILN